MDSQEDLAFLIRILTFGVTFRMPRTESASFNEPFGRYLSIEETAESIRILQNSRVELHSQLSMRHQDFGGAISAVDQYLPYIYQITNSIIKATEDGGTVPLDKTLIFKWTSGLANGTEWVEDQALMFDMAMTIGTKIIALSNLASLTAPEFSPAIAMLKEGAGLLDYLSKENLPDRYRLLECNSAMAEGFSIYFLFRAQLMAIAKAASGPSPKYSLLTKLCLGANGMLKQSIDIMRSRASAKYAQLNADLLKSWALQTYLVQGLAYYFWAQGAYAETKVGEAVAAMRKAKAFIQQRRNITDVGFPELEGQLSSLSQDVASMRAHFDKLEALYNKDNNSVYFMRVPSSDELELPGGVVMMQATPFAPPDMPLLSFTFPAQPSKTATPTTAQEIGWDCKSCTFKNDENSANCTVCNASRS